MTTALSMFRVVATTFAVLPLWVRVVVCVLLYLLSVRYIGAPLARLSWKVWKVNAEVERTVATFLLFPFSSCTGEVGGEVGNFVSTIGNEEMYLLLTSAFWPVKVVSNLLLLFVLAVLGTLYLATSLCAKVIALVIK